MARCLIAYRSRHFKRCAFIRPLPRPKCQRHPPIVVRLCTEGRSVSLTMFLRRYRWHIATVLPRDTFSVSVRHHLLLGSFSSCHGRTYTTSSRDHSKGVAVPGFEAYKPFEREETPPSSTQLRYTTLTPPLSLADFVHS